jgi:hypothetical protein
MIVFSGRPIQLELGINTEPPQGTSISHWFRTGFKNATMELKGLDLSNSLELCEQVIRRAYRQPASAMEPVTRQNLELLSRLLLGIRARFPR